jgi:hypothetical protein
LHTGENLSIKAAGPEILKRLSEQSLKFVFSKIKQKLHIYVHFGKAALNVKTICACIDANKYTSHNSVRLRDNR